MLLLLLSRFSHVRLCATPQTAAHQAPPALGFSRQEEWSGLPFPSPMHESEVAQSCPTLSDPKDCSPPGSSVNKYVSDSFTLRHTHHLFISPKAANIKKESLSPSFSSRSIWKNWLLNLCLLNCFIQLWKAKFNKSHRKVLFDFKSNH